jgi:pimeloyl-ACP methyl ester carboxylesterase
LRQSAGLVRALRQRGNIARIMSGRPRTLEEAKRWLQEKLAAGAHPMAGCDKAVTAPLIDALQGLDGARWAATWRPAGEQARERGRECEAAGDAAAAQRWYRVAASLFFLGRFPCPNHAAKLECARLEREAYLDAARFAAIPTRRVAVPFAGRAGEGSEVVFLYRRPPGVERPPVVLLWGGVDAWKEQLAGACDVLLARGVATIQLDNVGTGESPIVATVDGERQFLPLLDWVAAQPDLHPGAPACWGRSFGGYWATKLAHLYPERISGAVSWGGGAHYMFQRDWIEGSRHPDSYLMELVETRSRMLGARNDAEYIEFFGRLSLLDQGLLDRPCAPLLLVNGKEDKQCPVNDIHLLTEHGSPKAVRLFPGGHMGHTPQTVPTIVDWLAQQVTGSK